MLEHAWARVRTAAPAFPCLWLCGEPDRQSSPNLLQAVLLPALCICLCGAGTQTAPVPTRTTAEELSSCFAFFQAAFREDFIAGVEMTLPLLR